MKYVLVILTVASFLVSCKPDEQDIVVPQAEQRIAIASQLMPDNSLVLVLSKSFGALRKDIPHVQDSMIGRHEDLLVAGADVKLMRNGATLTLRELSPGTYVLDRLDEDGAADMEIVVSHPPTGMHATAGAYLMPFHMFDTVNASRTNDARYPAVLSFQLTDRPGERNWYVVNYFVKTPVDTVTDKGNIDYIAKRMLTQRNSFDLFTDSDFKEGKLAVTKRLIADEVADTIAVAVSNISEGYFQYLSARKKAGLLINQLRGEVINFPTNVHNGYGYFNLHKPDLRVLILNN